MPWYVARPHAPAWGWHWTMNAFDPEVTAAGRRQIASHYYPLIGPYHSGDPAVLEYHLLLMKLAGIDGVVVDWYGLSDHLDYAVLHRHTDALERVAGRLGMAFAVCYEDQTIPKLVAAGKLPAGDRVAHARRELDWLRANWFTHRHYVRLDGKPLLLSFGQDGLTDREWEDTLRDMPYPPVYVSEHRRRPAAAGAFDWPVPNDYPASLGRFERAATGVRPAIPVAFPRFHDIYEQGRAGKSYGRVADDSGRTWLATLERAVKCKPAVVQLATWNDWGEGTGIEPTQEFGYRDLEALQVVRKAHVDPAFPYRPADLRLAHRLWVQRQKSGGGQRMADLDELAGRIARGELQQASDVLERMEGSRE